METSCDPASSSEKPSHYDYIVIGGGIAGVTCAQTLSSTSSDCRILLLTASPLIKAVTNYRKVTKTLEEFDVEERPMAELVESHPNITVIQQHADQLDISNKTVTTADHNTYRFNKLCLCTGGKPKIIAEGNPFVIGIRDTETVQVFQKKLCNARRIMVVGNGGIATELVYEIEGCEVIWAVKHSSINSTFIDAGAATFFMKVLQQKKQPKPVTMKRTKYKINDDVSSSSLGTPGSALGPDWHEGLDMVGTTQDSRNVHVEYSVEVDRILTPDQYKQHGYQAEQLGLSEDDWPVYVKLTNDKVYGCDFVVSATGVSPALPSFVMENQFTIDPSDGGIHVDSEMRTSVCDVYAAGDVCHANWQHSPYWIQMRLWSQARQMSAYAAQCMIAHTNSESISLDFCFEVFAHVTRFFNYKVVLLGKFNGQGLGTDQELLIRSTKGMEYIKVVLSDGHLHGALLIGDTDMEETFENLILNQMDLTPFKDDLLNPNIDIDDFFD